MLTVKPSLIFTLALLICQPLVLSKILASPLLVSSTLLKQQLLVRNAQRRFLSHGVFRLPDHHISFLDNDVDAQAIGIYRSWQTETSLSPFKRNKVHWKKGSQILYKDIPYDALPLTSIQVPNIYARRTLDILAHGRPSNPQIMIANTPRYEKHSPLHKFGSANDAVWRAKQLADFLESNPIYTRLSHQFGQQLLVRLLICHSGRVLSRSSCLAEDLSKRLNKIVLAPSEILWLGSPGSKEEESLDLLMAPALPVFEHGEKSFQPVKGFFPFGEFEEDFYWMVYEPQQENDFSLF